MLTMHEATEIAKIYQIFQPYTSFCWQPLYWFLKGLMVNHSESEECTKAIEEFLESYNTSDDPTGKLVVLLRNNPLITIAEFEHRTVYARAKILYYYLNSPESIPETVRIREVKSSIDAVRPRRNWDVVVADGDQYFWLDGEWIWCGRR